MVKGVSGQVRQAIDSSRAMVTRVDGEMCRRFEFRTRLEDIDGGDSSALPTTGFHPETAFLIQQKHLPPQNKILVYSLWVEEWNALGERSTEWRDRGIIPNEHMASGTEEP